MTKFYNRQDKTEHLEPKLIPKNAVQNLSSYTVSNDKLLALSYGLDYQIPIHYNRNSIAAEFDYFYKKFTQ